VAGFIERSACHCSEALESAFEMSPRRVDAGILWRIVNTMNEAASDPQTPEFFLHTIDPSGARVIMSYCPRCNGFVAASPSLKIILIAETLHACSKEPDSY